MFSVLIVIINNYYDAKYLSVSFLFKINFILIMNRPIFYVNATRRKFIHLHFLIRNLVLSITLRHKCLRFTSVAVYVYELGI